MNADPVKDASKHFSGIYARSDDIAASEDYYRELITETITKSVRKVSVLQLQLPAVDRRGCIIAKSFIDELVDAVSSGVPLHALVIVFEKSDCPYVAALREAFAKEYSDYHAEYLAQSAGGDL